MEPRNTCLKGMTSSYDWHTFKYDMDDSGLTSVWLEFYVMLEKSDIHYTSLIHGCEHVPPCVRVLVKSRLRQKVERKLVGRDVLGYKFLSHSVETVKYVHSSKWYYCELCGWPKDECSDSD